MKKSISILLLLALTSAVSASTPVYYYRSISKDIHPQPSKKQIDRAVRAGKNLYLIANIEQLLLVGGGIQRKTTFRWKSSKNKPSCVFYAQIDCQSYCFWPTNILSMISVFLE